MTTEQRPDGKNWQSVRTILEGLILAALLWSLNNQSDQMKATVRLQTQVEALQQSNATMSNALTNALPQVNSDISTLKVRMDDNTRRISDLEQVRRLK
ncbi:hypothetical protein FHW84_001814 [Dyella sp. SG562]|uniref:hypothetical protein n=1 Tax=Dyella sp. SG562 TaxID=2587017 RepID=UPI001422138D|nr:hypothetical protein [Dyella sp. SG562]NII73245.1 hypothetical protein [Dyella sp. SG562]